MSTPVIQYRVDLTLNAAEAALRESLQAEGFGILTEVDVSAVLRQKLGVETARHKLLGACNPRIAHASIQAEPDVAAFLPCSISLREGANENETVVTVQDPAVISASFHVNDLAAPAAEARTKLQAALARIGNEV